MRDYWQLYDSRVTLHGATKRARDIHKLKTNLSNNLGNSGSYKEIKLNGKETAMIINTGTKPYYKEFQALPGQKVVTGDYVEWADKTWIVMEADCDDEVYIDGMLFHCNYIQRWMNSKGELIEKPSFVLNASAYNNGEVENNVITLATNQFMVYMPLDEETKQLHNGKRMFMSNNVDDPSVYELTRPDDVSRKFSDKGVTNYIFTQTEAHKNDLTDRKITLVDGTEVWIADYVAPSQPSDPVPPEETGDITAQISGSTNLKFGVQRTYTASFMDKEGDLLEETNFSWKIISDFTVNQDTNGNIIKLKVSDKSCIGSSFLLCIIIDDKTVAELKVYVVEPY